MSANSTSKINQIRSTFAGWIDFYKSRSEVVFCEFDRFLYKSTFADTDTAEKKLL